MSEMENLQYSPEILINSLGMKFHCVRIASPLEEPNRTETIMRNVGVVRADFAIGVYLIMQKEYFSILGVNPSYFQSGNDTDRSPVENITCSEAVKFCRKLSNLPEEMRLNRRYRLPTEAEWEYVYLAGQPGEKKEPSNLEDYAWIENNSDNLTHPVGQKNPNPWGIYDMSGNVWEWCLDSDVPEITDKTDLNLEPSPNFACSFRGGDFGCGAELCGIAKVHRVMSSYRGNFLGFRVVVDL